ncbi:MFS transporter [Nocardiopsis suaedae]|uniref:MFS transporter n=1 Tax=Nocardiopsis suaedae TaxID=3018444 RepID=A0ABT4TTG8_9ACTN|nr:MFS transporter [Nocardiopsis suaedae]MDA2807993.1 MFS transporter [Nocardiopsis suaedae]
MTTTAVRSAPPRRGVAGASAAALLAATLVTFLGASAAPTPLYALYQEAWGMAPSTTTVVFGVYALGLLAALLVVGRLSDHIGRRPVLLGAIALEAVSVAVFLAAGDLTALIAARVLQGLATGAATAAIGAAILDVAPTLGPIITGAAPVAGMGLGALGSGALVQFAPAPMRLVYAVLIVLLVAEAVGVARLAETAERRAGAVASLRPTVSVPPQARRAMLVAAPIDIAVWALGGFLMSLGPALTTQVTGSHAPLAGGATVFALTGAGALAIVGLRTVPAVRVMLIGAPTLAAGIVILLAGAQFGSVVLFFAGAVVSGVGWGAGFQGALRTVMPLAGPNERAGLMSAFYVLSYLALCLPAIAAGIATDRFGLTAVTDAYGVALIVLAALAMAGTLAMSRARTATAAGRAD